MSDRSVAETRWAHAFVLVAVTALFLTCLTTAPLVPLFDPDEGYYPATALESTASGSPWDPRLDGAPRWDKPILSYALIEGAFAIFGPNLTAARLPSAIEGAALVLIVAILLERLAGRRAGALAAVVLASSLGVQVFARAAHPEIAVVLSITVTNLLFVLWWTRATPHARLPIAVLAGVSLGYGALAKGPVAFVLPGLMLVAALPFLPRPWPPLRDALKSGSLAVVIALAVAAPWYIAMTAWHGQTFLAEALWKHNVVRYTTSEFGHRGSIFFFVLPTVVGLLPWSGFLLGFWRTDVTGAPLALRITRTCMIASAATAFAFYSLSGSKLANYALVVIPPLTILIALYINRLLDSTARRTAEEVLASAFVITIGAALLVIPLAVERGLNPRILVGGAPVHGAEAVTLLWHVIAAPAVFLLGSGVLAIAASRREIRVAAFAFAGFAAPLALLLSAQPLLDSTYPWRDFGAHIRDEPASVWVFAYRAPSLTFYGHQPVHRITDRGDIDKVLSASEAGWLVIDQRVWNELAPAPPPSRALVADAKGRMLLVRLGPPVKAGTIPVQR